MGILPTTVVIVPCYNEAARLDPAAFTWALAREPQLRFVFVDDGSTDATAEVVQQLIAATPDRATLLRLQRNSGKAEAVRAGILHAASLSPDVIGYWDADLATPLADIPTLAAAFDDPRVVLALGSRVRMLGRDVRRAPLRHYIGRGFATIASIVLELPVYDTQCGAKLFRATTATTALFETPFRLRWCFDVELIARFTTLPADYPYRDFVEIPVSQWVDRRGSKMTIRQAWRIVAEIWRLSAVVRSAKDQPSSGSSGVSSNF
ncbi:MAG TPA: glycosyltransferase [Vicinamibacterales bacterium]|jgi:glycosyltransferase involved in cell wall biosynthesis|nr:glycosyltransferase [Vicinamibacterales bacterium]